MLTKENIEKLWSAVHHWDVCHRNRPYPDELAAEANLETVVSGFVYEQNKQISDELAGTQQELAKYIGRCEDMARQIDEVNIVIKQLQTRLRKGN
jgi:hypothetical protein